MTAVMKTFLVVFWRGELNDGVTCVTSGGAKAFVLFFGDHFFFVPRR
jgi:hypothetical protein